MIAAAVRYGERIIRNRKRNQHSTLGTHTPGSLLPRQAGRRASKQTVKDLKMRKEEEEEEEEEKRLLLDAAATTTINENVYRALRSNTTQQQQK